MDDQRVPLHVKPEHLDYLLICLRQRPWGEVDPIITDLRQQIALQNAPGRPRSASNGAAEATPPAEH